MKTRIFRDIFELHTHIDAHNRIVRRASEAHLPADEQRQVVIVPSVEHREHRLLGVRGGQDRTGAELLDDACPLVVALCGAVATLVAAIARAL